MPQDPEDDDQQGWTEEASALFVDAADLFVPARAEQIATLVGLIPAYADEAFAVAELAAGDGTLAEALLRTFPRCRYLALDGSEVMREHLRARLSAHGERFEVRPFRMEEHDWRAELPQPLRCVVSSLCVHHLDGAGKRALFADLATRLEPGGALLLADIVEPARPRLAALYAQQYDEIVRAQSLAATGDLSGFERFQAEHWNYFIYDYGAADSVDHPSPLADQLVWLRASGFGPVDCFWLRAGHAVYGGYLAEG
jgi:tRNA (cmo5U34)-methyltransferase